MLNFSSPFSTTQNLSDIFTTLSKAAGGGASNNIGPQYYDGAMFANDYEWYTYGGQLRTTDAFKAPAGNAVAAYQVYPSGPPKDFNKGYILDTLPDGVTRYVTDGAAVSVPSENLGFYFGGLRSATYGPIFYLPGPRNQSVNPDQLSTTLIEVDLAKQGGETWNNSTLPTTVPGRANPEIVWIPVSEQGILVAIGGVIFPSYANVNQTNNASATAQSVRLPSLLCLIPQLTSTRRHRVLSSCQQYLSMISPRIHGMSRKRQMHQANWLRDVLSYRLLKMAQATISTGTEDLMDFILPLLSAMLSTCYQSHHSSGRL